MPLEQGSSARSAAGTATGGASPCSNSRPNGMQPAVSGPTRTISTERPDSAIAARAVSRNGGTVSTNRAAVCASWAATSRLV